ncbi:MAG: antirestriction protein ArdA [Pseudomonadota bacterium]
MTYQLATAAPVAASAAPARTDRPRIYVACLAAYNDGCLHGRWIDATTPDEIWEKVRAAFDEYAGEYRSAAEFAEQLHEDAGTEIPESLRYYIDWQALARDMALNGEIMVFQTGFDEVHVFWTK